MSSASDYGYDSYDLGNYDYDFVSDSSASDYSDLPSCLENPAVHDALIYIGLGTSPVVMVLLIAGLASHRRRKTIAVFQIIAAIVCAALAFILHKDIGELLCFESFEIIASLFSLEKALYMLRASKICTLFGAAVAGTSAIHNLLSAQREHIRVFPEP